MTYPSNPKAALHVSDTVMVPCPECSGFGTVTIAHTLGVIGTGRFYEERCPTCDGAGEVEAVCPCCEHELDKHGWCVRCEEYGLEEAPLTEVRPDPFGERFAA